MRLILGDGLLGSEIHKQSGWSYISRKKDGIDFTNIDSYKYYLTKLGITEVINCIAHTNTIAETDIDMRKSWTTNYLAVMNLADFCNEQDIKLIHISTDYIYAKTKKIASERDLPIHYNNYYTYSKLMADNYIIGRTKKWLIMRSSFKPRPFPHDSAWIDLIGNFDYVDVIAKLMIELISHNALGIYNVGTELKSMYDLAKQTNLNVKSIHKGSEFIDSNDISMSTTKMDNFLKIERSKKNEFCSNSRSL